MQIKGISIHFNPEGDEIQTMNAWWETPVGMANVDEIYKVIIKFLKANGIEEIKAGQEAQDSE